MEGKSNSPPELLAKYKEAKEKYKKSTICYHYWRKCCYFTKERCKYAHGLDDLKRYPREEFIEIRKSFFRLKGEVHGNPNPQGIDPHPIRPEAKDFTFSSDEEEGKIFKTKRKARSKEEHAELKVWQQQFQVEFALFLFKEANTNFIPRDLFENLYSDVKLKFDMNVIADKMKAVYQKNALLSSSTKVRSHVVLLYPVLEKIMDPLAEYFGNIAKIMITRCKFPIYYKEFEKVYNEQLPIELPMLKLLCELFHAKTNIEFINLVEFNKTIMDNVKSKVGEEVIKDGFIMDAYCTPEDKEKISKKLNTIWVASSNIIKDWCVEICHETFQFFKSFDKPIKGVMVSVGFKQIITGTRIYYVRKSGDTKKFAFVMDNKECPCKAKKFEENIDSLPNCIEKEKIKDVLIDGKILWVSDFDTLHYAISITDNVDQIGIDLEGYLSKGNIDMLQMGVGEYILLVDLYIIKMQTDLFEKTASWICNLMMNSKITKIFFDCHRDSEALHKAIGCCVENAYDIQAMHMLIKQWKIDNKNDNTVSMPGLNKSLEEYKASHGVNEYKEIMHEIFKTQAGSYEKRPLSLMYIRYAAKDVEDLIEVKEKMLAELDTMFKNGIGKKIAEVLSIEYVKQGCKSILGDNVPDEEAKS